MNLNGVRRELVVNDVNTKLMYEILKKVNKNKQNKIVGQSGSHL